MVARFLAAEVGVVVEVGRALLSMDIVVFRVDWVRVFPATNISTRRWPRALGEELRYRHREQTKRRCGAFTVRRSVHLNALPGNSLSAFSRRRRPQRQPDG